MITQEILDVEETSLARLTGHPVIQSYFKSLYAGLESWAERHGLDTAETLELMQSVSTVTENPSLSTSQAHQMLMSGYRGLSWIMKGKPDLHDFILPMLEAMPNVRQAYWEAGARGRKRLVTKRTYATRDIVP